MTSDGELLERFALERDGEAFERLMLRHGPMVVGICQRMLGNQADAQDAAQATFLVLAQRAWQVAGHRCLAAWLHRVAARICLDVRRAQGRRRQHEQAAGLLRGRVGQPEEWLSAEPMLDQAISALPGKYRVAIVLHHLQGRTQEEAAELAGCGISAMAMRLMRGRQMLRERLMPYVGIEEFELPHSAAEMPGALAKATAGVAVALVAGDTAGLQGLPQAMAWSRACLRSLWMAQAKVAAAILIATAGVAGVAAVGASAAADAPARAPVAALATAATTQGVDYAMLALDEARKVADSRIGTLERIVEAQVVQRDYAGAEATIRLINDERQVGCMLVHLARAMAEAGDVEGAQEIAEQVGPEDLRLFAEGFIASRKVDQALDAGEIETAQKAAAELKDPMVQVQAYGRMVKHLAGKGETVGARDVVPQMRDAVERATWVDANGAYAARQLAEAEAMAGDDTAALRTANAIGDVVQRWMAYSEIAGAQASRGDVAAAMRTIEGIGGVFEKALGYTCAARECIRRNDPENARRLLAQAVDLFHANQGDAGARWTVHYIADEQGRIGQIAEAKALAGEVQDPRARAMAYEKIAAQQARRDGAEATYAWARGLKLPIERAQAYAGIVRGMAEGRSR